MTLLTVAAFSAAAVNETYLSLQGYSGIINTPNAMIFPDGNFAFLFSNQTPPNLYDRDHDTHFNDFILTIGIFPHIEVTGRFLNSASYPVRGPRDLSVNVKCGYSFYAYHPWLPSIACGIQDISGGATYLSTKYMVLSEEIGNVRISFGYGTGPSRMEGIFFGAELFITPFLQLLFDNDREQTGMAVRLATSFDETGNPFAMSLMVKNVFREKKPIFTLAASVSCDLNSRHFGNLTKHDDSDNRISKTETSEKEPAGPVLQNLIRKLSEYGFQNISATAQNRRLVIYYENNHFNHNEMDALGIVLGTAATETDSLYDTLQVTILRTAVPLLSVKTERIHYLQFLKTGNAAKLNLKVTDPPTLNPLSIRNKTNVTTGRVRCELSPGLRYFLGTEVGAFDYQLSLNSDVFISLWPGGTCAARMVFPLWNTRNFDSQKAFSVYREKTHLNSASLFQFVNFGHGVTTLISAGLYDKKYYSIINDLRFTNGSGFFRIGAQGGYFKAENTHRSTMLLYTGFQLPCNLLFTITGGVFWEQDTGIDLSVIRRFNDVEVKFFGKYTKTIFNTYDKFVGGQIILPLTFRKDMRPWFVSVSGKNDWHTALSTRVAMPEERNTVSTACGVIPDRLLSLGSDYYNRERLNRTYILSNSDLLRDAWILYGFQ